MRAFLCFMLWLAYYDSVFLIFFQSYIRSTQGATGLEYGLLLAGIGVSMIGALFAFGDEFRGMLDTMAVAFESAFNS